MTLHAAVERDLRSLGAFPPEPEPEGAEFQVRHGNAVYPARGSWSEAVSDALDAARHAFTVEKERVIEVYRRMPGGEWCLFQRTNLQFP